MKCAPNYTLSDVGLSLISPISSPRLVLTALFLGGGIGYLLAAQPILLGEPFDLAQFVGPESFCPTAYKHSTIRTAKLANYFRIILRPALSIAYGLRTFKLGPVYGMTP
jgi:hypothetical protein